MRRNMTFIRAGSTLSRGCSIAMEKLDKLEVLNRIAAAMRAQAEETDLPEYQSMLIRTAISLEAEANGSGEMAILEVAGYPNFQHTLH
jgi:hypothetical protein